MIQSHTDARSIYKVVDRTSWEHAEAAGAFEGSPDDRRDGFIHLSTSVQVLGTLAKHFRGRDDLVLVAFRASDLGAALKFEPSRGGDFFPHLYAPLPTGLALWQRPLSLGLDGVPVIEEGWFGEVE